MQDVARAQQETDASLCPTLASGVRPRLCHVVKDEGGFGFSVTHGELRACPGRTGLGSSTSVLGDSRLDFTFFSPLGARGPFWLVLSAGGAAERAGVPPGARLLEVNGVSVEKFTYSQLSRKVRLPTVTLPT